MHSCLLASTVNLQYKLLAVYFSVYPFARARCTFLGPSNLNPNIKWRLLSQHSYLRSPNLTATSNDLSSLLKKQKENLIKFNIFYLPNINKFQVVCKRIQYYGASTHGRLRRLKRLDWLHAVLIHSYAVCALAEEMRSFFHSILDLIFPFAEIK